MPQFNDTSGSDEALADDRPIRRLRCWATIEMRMETGQLFVRGVLRDARARRVRCVLRQRENVIHEERFTPEDFEAGVSFRDIPVRLWWPAGSGDQVLYDLSVMLLDADDRILETVERRLGFKHGAWVPEDEAPSGMGLPACIINGRAVPLHAVDWTGPAPGEAAGSHRAALERHRAAGVNVLRVGGSGGLAEESPDFYDACDELGLLVWQAIPVSSASHDARASARDCVARLQHHPSLLGWSLIERLCHDAEVLAQMEAIVEDLDPTRRIRVMGQ